MTGEMKMKKQLVLLILIVHFVAGCSSMTALEKDQKRSELDEMATTTIASLVSQNPAIEDEINHSLGYGVAGMKLTKVPIFGAGGGEGVFINQKSRQHTYFKVTRLDIGGGWGVRSYRVLLIINSQQVMDRFEGGTWIFEAGAEVSAGTASSESSTAAVDTGFTMHVLSDAGASATVTARVIRIRVDKNLIEDF